MQLIGLTGGIASGKSAVAVRLAERGAIVVDADVIAREVVMPGTPTLARIVEEFGPEVISEDGSLNRPALGALIFTAPEKRAALNAITHPAVEARSHELFAAAGAANPDAIVVYDVPLLVDTSRVGEFDTIVVVNASTETRVNRMIAHRGMTRDEALHRINSQATDTARLAIADIVIDANGTLEETLQQADAVWKKLSAR
jgi:dephospho-CoA kinase